jgi:peptidoglycan hydrolase-like protein with peptidoglycan-binding domain
MAIDIKSRWAWAEQAVRTGRGGALTQEIELAHPGMSLRDAADMAMSRIALGAGTSQGPWDPTDGGVFIHYAGSGNFAPANETDCLREIADIWAMHFPKFNADIGYNYLVCPHGNIYTGRGHLRGEANGGSAPATANTPTGHIQVPGRGAVGRNSGFYSILGLIRGSDQPTGAMLGAMKSLIRHLRNDVAPHLRAGPALFPHKKGYNTECPGNLTAYAQAGSAIDPGPAAPVTPSPTPSPISIVPRAAWGARPPRAETAVPFSSRVGFAVHYSAGPPSQRVAAIQNYHMDGRGWPDIGYNFLVDRNGRIYEGRGWLTVGAHATGYNTSHIGVCFIGSDGDATPAAKAAIRSLYYRARQLAGRPLTATYHGAIGSTACPGADLRNWVIGGMAADDIPIGGGDLPDSSSGLTTVRSVRAQQQAVNLLGHTPVLAVDGSFGPLTLAGVKWLQRRVGVADDGMWGPLTEAAYVAHIGAGGSGGTAGVTAYRSIKAQQYAVNKLGYTPPLVLDNSFGPLTLAGVKWLQRQIGTDPDGNWGPATEKAYRLRTGETGGSTGGGISTIRPVVSQQYAVNAAGYTPPLELDGSFGPLTDAGVKWLQRLIGTDADGMWGPATEAAYQAWSDGEQLVVDGSFGTATISATQRAIGVVADGSWGPASKRALQRHLNTWADAGLVVDGSTGPATVTALQRHLNTMVGAGLALDGVWGTGTTRALQTALNRGKF